MYPYKQTDIQIDREVEPKENKVDEHVAVLEPVSINR